MGDATDFRLASWAKRLLAEFDAVDGRAKQSAQGLSALQLNWQPSPGAWSVGQCIDHLRATNEVYVPAMAAALSGRPVSPVQDITPGWFSLWFIRSYIEPSAESKRARAPGKIVPGAKVREDVLDLFLRSNERVRDLVRRASEYDVNKIRFGNPFVPLLRFSVGGGLEIVSGHQRRHLLQAERVKQAAGFPGR